MSSIPPLRPGAGVLLALAFLMVFNSACRRKLAEPDAGPDAASPAADRAEAPPPAPPCLQAPGSFAELGSRLARNLVTLIGEPHDDPGPPAALPLFDSTAPAASPPRTERRGPPLASGFLLDRQGFLVTSARASGARPQVKVRLHDGSLRQAALRGAAPEADLALYTLPQPPRDALDLTDAARLRPGDWVAVLSDPFGGGLSLTAGVVRFRHGLEAPGLPPALSPFIGVDATIDEANWGGLVVDSAGRMVGLAAAASSAGSRIGLVLPAAELRRRVAQLTDIERSERTWLGLWARPIGPEAAAELGLDPPRGLVVTRLVPAGPADQAGLLPRDVILEFAGEPVESPAALGALAARLGADQSAPVTVWRDGRRIILRLRPAPMPQ